MDTVATAALGTVAIAGGVLLADGISHNNSHNTRSGEIYLGLELLLPAGVIAIISAFSAEYGFRHTKRCQQLRQGTPGRQPTSAEWVRGASLEGDGLTRTLAQ